jgi:hypothetical protein
MKPHCKINVGQDAICPTLVTILRHFNQESKNDNGISTRSRQAFSE